MSQVFSFTTPLVTVVVPVFNDEDSIAASLDSALAQTLSQIEILVVDDASTDRTPDIVAAYAARDPRVRLIRHSENMSGFQARRTGIFAAQAPFVMFLDGDDELEPYAAARSAVAIEEAGADILQFGIQIVYPDGSTGSSWEARSQPTHASLHGEDVALGLFPAGRPAAGQLWKYLFRRDLLRAAYEQLPGDARFYRANDLPIAFLASVLATSYASIPDKLYRYFWRRGASAMAPSSREAIDFQTSVIDAFDSTTPAIHEAAYRHSDPQTLLDAHESARESIAAIAMKWTFEAEDPELFGYAVEQITQRMGRVGMVRSAARYQPAVLDVLAERDQPVLLGGREVKSILITSANLTTGGVSMVVLAQAKYLAQTGHRVTIAVRRPGNDPRLVPEGVAFYEVTKGTLAEKLDAWADICAEEEIDVVIDHRILYSRDWHAWVQMSSALGIPTIGWIHNFAGRPIYDLSDTHSYLRRALPSLAQLVTLSPLDVAFWKLRGVPRVAYLPNPPSPLILEHVEEFRARSAPRGPIELIWVGRMEQHTKQVKALLSVASELRKLEVDFRLRVVGPDQPDYTAEQFNQAASRAGIAEQVRAIGPLTGQDLVDALDSAHAFVGTSLIEGYQLTIVEAQSRGLPVFLYDMPWLVTIRGNAGVVAVPQGNAAMLARRIAEAFADPTAYEALSASAIDAAYRVSEVDYATLYEQLVTGELPPEVSPEPTLRDAADLLDLTVFFAERHAGVRDRLQTAEKSARVGRRRIERLEHDLQSAQKASRVSGRRVERLGQELTEARKSLRSGARRIERLEHGLSEAQKAARIGGRRVARLEREFSEEKRHAGTAILPAHETQAMSAVSSPRRVRTEETGPHEITEIRAGNPRQPRVELYLQGWGSRALPAPKGNLVEQAVRTLKTRARRKAEIVGARVSGGVLGLRLRAPYRQEIVEVELYRWVPGGLLSERMALSAQADGSVLALCEVGSLGRRRWKVRASIVSAGTVRVVNVPIKTSARSVGEGSLKVRFHDLEAVQVYSRGDR